MRIVCDARPVPAPMGFPKDCTMLSIRKQMHICSFSLCWDDCKLTMRLQRCQIVDKALSARLKERRQSAAMGDAGGG